MAASMGDSRRRTMLHKWHTRSNETPNGKATLPSMLFMLLRTFGAIEMVHRFPLLFIIITIISGGYTVYSEEKCDVGSQQTQISSDSQQASPYFSVTSFGAKGDGVTDDTEAIQSAINHVYRRGGGTVYFPYAPKGYRIAKPAVESVDGKACRSQLYIPAPSKEELAESPKAWARNICLLGEMPVMQLYAYQMTTGGNWPKTEFEMPIPNCTLISDWEAPENTNQPNERPWALISVLDSGNQSPFSLANLTVRNLEFRVKLDTERMYPTSSAANFIKTSRLIVEHCYFGLSKNVASASQNKALKANPSYCAGLIASADQNDHQAFRSVGVQGFRYGFVFGEHVVADYLYVHNCMEGIVFHDSSHLSHINHVVAQHNRIIVSALQQPTFQLRPSNNIYFQINSIDFERGTNEPKDYMMQYGVYDPDNRMKARIVYHSGYPVGVGEFPIYGGKNVSSVQFFK